VIPGLTVAGIQLGQLMAGSIVLETVFYLPGLGRLAIGAISARDLPVVQGVVLFVASVIVTINVAVDVIYGVRAPRPVTFTVGLAVTLVLLTTAALSLVYTPRDPLEMPITGRLQGPTGAHPFGTDQFGRDLLSRVMTGAVTSILVGVIAVGIGM